MKKLTRTGNNGLHQYSLQIRKRLRGRIKKNLDCVG